jgi:hypothetical protein
MTLQLAIVLIIVALALGYLVWGCARTWQTARGKACPGGCGCDKSRLLDEPAAFIAASELRLKERR